MKLLSCLCVLSLGQSTNVLDDAFGDEGMSLLQLRASTLTSPLHKLFSNTTQKLGGHPFGCTGRHVAQNVITCGLWGDVHQHKQYNGNHAPNSDGTGWYWVAKSKDGAFQAQAFYREWDGVWSCMSHFAFKFGDDTVFLDRNLEGGRWIWKYYWNGDDVKSFSDTPMEVGDVYWVNKAAGAPQNLGGKDTSHNVLAYTPENDSERLSCFEYKEVSVWTSFQNWKQAEIGAFVQPANIEVEGNIDFLDTTFGQCAWHQQKVQPNEMLVTIPQNDKVCRDNLMDEHECQDPDPPPPPPTKEEQCEKNGVEMSHAEDLCADQQAHGNDIYDDCLYDVCASVEADAQLNAVGGAELEAAVMNPEAICNVNTGDSCLPCNICTGSQKVDLSNVVQNNLGGLGPDSGAEEIRYKHAIDLDGRKVDVVLAAESTYSTPKSSVNGNSDGGFGVFTMKTKTSTNFKFSFVDANTDEPVGVKDLALTFYDLDQAKNTRQQETISACGAGEVYTTSDTELVHSNSGVCHSLTSTTKGTGKDNPSSANDLTKTQAARSVTYEFHSRATISFSASISGKGKSPRPILFSFEPQVACGASDAEKRCAQ